MVKEPDKSQHVAADLRDKVMTGFYEPGEALPSTARLVETYQVAASTVSKAVGILKEEGFLRGEVGRAVFVRNKQPFVVAATAYKEPSPRGYKYDLLQVAEVDPSKEVSQALRLAEGERVVVRKRLLLWDGDPVELSWSYYPLSFAAGTPLSRKAKIRGGAPQVLTDLGLSEKAFEDRVSVRQPLKEEIDALRLPASVPVFRQFRTVYTDNNRPVEVSVLIKGGHLFELLYHQPVLPEKDSTTNR